VSLSGLTLYVGNKSFSNPRSDHSRVVLRFGVMKNGSSQCFMKRLQNDLEVIGSLPAKLQELKSKLVGLLG
jgi:hypothetical protein